MTVINNPLKEEWINKNHYSAINGFSCIDEKGDNQVQLFLQEEALDLLERNLVRTRLFFDEYRNLIGFYSLFNNTIKANKGKREELSIYLPYEVKEIPAIRLHYIGVDNKYRRQGHGDYLMTSVLVNCAKIAQLSGCSIITVESTKNAIGFYEKYGFVHIRTEGNFNLMGINTKGILDLVK